MTSLKVTALALGTALTLGFAQFAQADVVKTQLGDLTLNGDLVLADGKSLKDGVVLFTHGTWMHRNYSTAEALKTNFTEMGTNVLAINLSLGKNDREDQAIMACDGVHKHKHTDAIQEIDAWVQWLKSKGAGPITLAGHSRGGNQTAWYASLHNDEEAVKNIVLIAPQLWDEAAELAEYKDKYKKDLKPLLAKAEKLVAAGKGDNVMPNTDFVYCADSSVTAATFVDYYQVNPKMNTLNLLPKIKKPVLVFSGSEDTTVVDLAKKLEPFTAKYDNIQSHEVVDATHMFLDFSGAEVVEVSEEFIK